MAQNSNGNGTIKIGATLTAGDKVFSWLSPSGEFAFGFHQLRDNKDLFLLAIWFNKLPEKTLVWYADTPNSPIPKGSKLELTADRGLLLTDPRNQELWKSGTIVSQADMAIFNDTGNFVLFDRKSEKIWESFNHPTDTLLPTQVLEKGVVVSSRVSSTNFSRGRFQLSLKTDGKFGLYIMNLPSEHLNSNYYTKETTNTGKQLVFNESESASIANYYYRATLDFDGVFTKYSYPKNPTKDSNWSVVWSIPDNICLQRFAYGNSGVCGYNRVCRLDQNKRPLCECIRGFSLYRGCKPSFLQSCVEDSKSSAESRYTIEEMKDVDWPSGDYEILQPYDKENCKEACLSDCTCAIAIYRKNACWKKRLPLNNGKFDTTAEAIAFIKVRKSDFPLENPSSSSSSSSKTKSQNVLIIAGSILLGTSLFVNFLLVEGVSLGFFFIYKKRVTRSQHDKEVSRLNLRCFTYKDLTDATDDFKEEVGRGSFGIVYKGTLKDTNEQVAVKKLDRAFQDSEKEFKAEVNVIECSTQIIHCDIKPQNILLDESYNARIVDFGLAKLLLMNQSHTNTNIRGTKGYVAPEWYSNMPITFKVDVYSFGVLLLEIICCRRNVDIEIGDEEEAILVYWAYDYYKEGRMDVLVGNDMEIIQDMNSLKLVMMMFQIIFQP
ncbi:hypothetical protein F8388_005330 [Cannabis sativa]|uniref:Non-specific serine/threonine protein kinase n=1 Tax=Cannabis sativa TaxID=3483 RepID=A0A7J6ELJ3_CANSA|nr:hypothetical protein F8388_005330 [Cannabis sativa]